MRREDFHYDLPRERIAQAPAQARSASRLLALDGETGARRDLSFGDLPGLLDAADLLVFNDTRVIPARAFGCKPSGGRVELLLERVEGATRALLHARSSKRLRPQGVVQLAAGCSARVLGREGELYRLEFSCDVLQFFEQHGAMPLPPYIARPAQAPDRDRYQTVYARVPGAVAAPTAGLHFDHALFAALAERGVRREFLTLHVGAGTFAPVRSAEVEQHVMHAERVEVPAGVCTAIERTRAAGGRVVAVGTTVVRALEAAANGGSLRPLRGETRIFIKPGHRFRAVDAILTNFHLPESTLLMLCAAFVGRETLLDAYAHAVREHYRFFSYGDATFLSPRRAALERP
ncbi:MAG TPA: tRNA preQ1(34) S-adenosylmethionine ribosyltransferase-isomerase QueA [Steroidobacteraceae bacterium]|nr:tRNA preQ1(34) S-adenosylmethionine ribosyltransferase-isomerase QueA [Steroidobacteraceae bacterium]